MKRISLRRNTVLPGFGLTLGFTVFYLSLVVLLPLAALTSKAATLSVSEFLRITTTPRAFAAYRVTFGTSLAASIANVFFGFIVAWTLVRYRFPGRRFLDGMVDLPFALPTSVSGITLAHIYNENGWLGRFLYPLGIPTAYSCIGITIALTFIGMPFVVRTLQPALEDLHKENEEAAASLGATRFQTFCWVIVPSLAPAIVTGFSMAFARAIGEYGSVAFISGNMPMKTEIASLLIVGKLDQHDVAGATAIATVMLLASFALLFAINVVSAWSGRRAAGSH